jgi:hypothetical protein
VTAELIQARLSMSSLWIHAMACSLSRLDANLRKGLDGSDLEYEMATVEHLCAMANEEIGKELRSLHANCDPSVKRVAASVMKWAEELPHDRYDIPEKTPDASARGKGRPEPTEGIPQFGSGSIYSGPVVAKA